MVATYVPDHVAQALSRRLGVYAETVGVEWFLSSVGTQVQDLEDALFQLIDSRWLDTATGAQLDMLGEILDVLRIGNTDDDYRKRLKAAVVRYRSTGRPEDVIQAFTLLTDSTRTLLFEVFPAEINVAAVGGFSIIGSEAELRQAVTDVLAAGVALGAMVIAPNNPFVFQGYPFPEGRGFGTVTDPLVGGTFAKIM